ncbi:MAG: cell division protein ZapA [Oscillospiraceae bacterium]
MKNEITVRLFNRDYRLMTDETKEYTDNIAKELNQRMSELLQSKLTMSVQDAAALIALECYDELIKSRENVDRIRTQVKDYIDDASQAKVKAEKAQSEVEKLHERVAQLENMLKQNNASQRNVSSQRPLGNVPYNTFRNNNGVK